MVTATAASEPPSLSALSKYIACHPRPSGANESDYSLALQIQHNLQYQHDWSELSIHTHSPLTQQLLPRPLISGLPPHRIYVHPDDQVEELKRGIKEEDAEVEREWVLPTQLREKWNLRRFAEVFDAVGEEVPKSHGAEHGWEEMDLTIGERAGKRRGGKRLLLATLGEDSTVVYYVMHDGIVKPRQN